MKPILFLALAAAFLAGCASRENKARGPQTAPTQALRTTERPGLATTWGETRIAWVEPTYFARAWGRPSAVSTLYYNDQPGVTAMLEYLGGEPRNVSGPQSIGGLVRLGLRGPERRWLETWEAGGKRIATAERGGRYEIFVQNETRKRVEVVLSVDGLDTLDGKPAGTRKRGYVLAPREAVTIEGFRTSDGTVSAFHFGGVGESYAERKHGDATNAGIIGLAVFSERWNGTPPQAMRPEHRAWRACEPRDFPSSRTYATPPDA